MPGEPHTTHHLRLTVAPDTGELAHLRHRIQRWLTRHGQQTDDWLLVANELCTNSMAVATEPIEVIMTVDDDGVVLEVIDDGPGFDLEIVDPAVDSVRRRGLWIVEQLTTRLSVAHNDGRTTVSVARTTMS